MKRFLIRLAILAAGLGVVGAGVVAAGLVPVAASSGHWAITTWVLHGTMRRSVATRSLGVEAPDLERAALVAQGAGHYETGCAPCHGAPGEPRSAIVHHMTPEPPRLEDRIPTWEAEELFWIVKHGIKFSAMPAWPARERDDEVWAMVAFLEDLPALTPEDYRRLSRGGAGGAARLAALEGTRSADAAGDEPASARPPAALLEDCARCHGEEGAGRGVGAFPKLAGQSAAYLAASLQAYADGDRHSGMMQPVAAGLEAGTIRAVADWYAGRPPPSETDGRAGDGMATVSPPDPEALERGRAIAAEGLPGQGVPACRSCHGAADPPRPAPYPNLAGQYRDYLETQLRLFAEGRRGGTPYAHIMESIAGRLTAEQRADAAAFYATADPE